jgi:hypothetical protein
VVGRGLGSVFGGWGGGLGGGGTSGRRGGLGVGLWRECRCRELHLC